MHGEGDQIWFTSGRRRLEWAPSGCRNKKYDMITKKLLHSEYFIDLLSPKEYSLNLFPDL